MNVKKNIALPAIMVGTFILEVFLVFSLRMVFLMIDIFLFRIFTYYVDDYDLFL